ncbi:cytosol aminopeptidase-like [Papilio machaon]|uniref:cytosol aminopeptidase-like n=1 Tax=Papilio machaon TaxID=76193 RepID=UPI001E66533C|nr:cytosol aminopeptidase-like [Papilio machaon]
MSRVSAIIIALLLQKGVVVGVFDNGKELELTCAGREIDQRSGGKLARQLNEVSCQLKLGHALVVTDVGEEGDVALACCGLKHAGYNKLEELDEKRENVRWGIGAGVRALQARGCARVLVDSSVAPDAAAEAAHLAAWRFQEFKSSVDRQTVTSVAMYECKQPSEQSGEKAGEQVGEQAGAQGGEECAALWARGAVMGEAQNWARYLSDMPANKMTPIGIAQAALDTLCPLGVQVWARDGQWAAAQRMEAFLAVARGSCEPPYFLDCSYNGASSDTPPVLLAAKGVTFDSGGLCLKPPEHMRENRGSMSGAAVVLAAIKAIAELKIPINIRAVIPLCENLVSGQCMKVGDVVRALNGTSIQIEDTDMEGRLLLADALVYGQAAYRPALVVDVATLTRGVLLATGGGAFGCFSNVEGAWLALRSAGASSGDRPWRFPLWNYYHAQITDDPSVDLRNKGSGKATPCIGAAFLRNFVCGEWVHLDVTGVGKLAHAAAPPYLRRRRMSGRPARTLAYFLAQLPNYAATHSGQH